MSVDWHARFLVLASHISTWSKDPSTKVGCVIVDAKRRVVGLGYNGFPRGVKDDPVVYSNRPAKYPRVVHAELNAILNAPLSVEGCTLYCTPFLPCNECAKAIIQAGIARVVAPHRTAVERWDEAHVIAIEMFEQAGVEVIAL